jgi:chaperone BCS1
MKTKQQLEKFFFEHRYNDKNEHNGVSFDKKIIVFEDIDCVGDIVLSREHQKNGEHQKTGEQQKNKDTSVITLDKVCEIPKIKIEEPITLDDILNLWDGIRETPGRMLIITSNHYEKLDSALTRPGRIDITHKLDNASHNTIAEIYNHLFEKPIDIEKLQNINDCFYSPAEIINIYVTHKEEDKFIERLLQNKKLSDVKNTL